MLISGKKLSGLFFPELYICVFRILYLKYRIQQMATVFKKKIAAVFLI